MEINKKNHTKNGEKKRRRQIVYFVSLHISTQMDVEIVYQVKIYIKRLYLIEW